MLFKQPFSTVPPQAVAVPRVRYFRVAPETRTRTVVGPYSATVHDELLQAKIAWKIYQSTRERGAVYDYLRAVFKVVRRWRKEHRAKASSRQALKVAGRINMVRNREPFAIVILCTSDPGKVDAKTRSKWSRVLRYANQFKADTEKVADARVERTS